MILLFMIHLDGCDGRDHYYLHAGDYCGRLRHHFGDDVASLHEHNRVTYDCCVHCRDFSGGHLRHRGGGDLYLREHDRVNDDRCVRSS